MLRVNVGLSRKLSKDFNSTGFSINLDGEVTAAVADSEAVIEQVKELFDLAEEALNHEIERAESESAIARRDDAHSQATHQNGRRSPSTRREANGTNGHRESPQEEAPATNKQISYLLSIGKRQKLTTAQLEAKVAEILNSPVGLYDLTKKSAAVVIDALTTEPSEPRPASRF